MRHRSALRAIPGFQQRLAEKSACSGHGSPYAMPHRNPCSILGFSPQTRTRPFRRSGPNPAASTIAAGYSRPDVREQTYHFFVPLSAAVEIEQKRSGWTKVRLTSDITWSFRSHGQLPALHFQDHLIGARRTFFNSLRIAPAGCARLSPARRCPEIRASIWCRKSEGSSSRPNPLVNLSSSFFSRALRLSFYDLVLECCSLATVAAALFF